MSAADIKGLSALIDKLPDFDPGWTAEQQDQFYGWLAQLAALAQPAPPAPVAGERVQVAPGVFVDPVADAKADMAEITQRAVPEMRAALAAAPPPPSPKGLREACDHASQSPEGGE